MLVAQSAHHCEKLIVVKWKRIDVLNFWLKLVALKSAVNYRHLERAFKFQGVKFPEFKMRNIIVERLRPPF